MPLTTTHAKMCSCMLFASLVGVCCGFVLLSSPVGAGTLPEVFPPGNSWRYAWQTGALLGERSGGKDVGFFVEGELQVDSVWGKDAERVFRFQLKNPKLHVRSQKSADSEGFAYHSSQLETFKNKPFLVAWNKGSITEIVLHRKEPTSLKNIKKAIASLFQFQLTDQTISEVDSCGNCETVYSSSNPTHLIKLKSSCKPSEFPYVNNPEPLLSTEVNSHRQTIYEFDSEGKYFKSVSAKEVHEMFLAVYEGAESRLTSEQKLVFKSQSTSDSVFEGGDSKEVLQSFLAKNIDYSAETLLLEREEDNGATLMKAVEEVKEDLKSENLGTLPSAKAFIKLVGVARRSSKEEVAKVLGSKKFQNILTQIYDVLGYTQTLEVHDAVMKKLHLEEKSQMDLSERYLWACSFSSQPNPDVMKDLLNKYRKLPDIPEQVQQTLILTLASMAHRLGKLPYQPNKYKVIKAVEDMLEVGLNSFKDDKRFVFLRAYKNLKSPHSVPLLIEVIKKGTRKEGALAWRALHSMPSIYNENLKIARETFFQLDKKHDSTARTHSADILLHSALPEDLKDLLYYLRSNDTSFEIKQYVLQRIRAISEKDVEFESAIRGILRDNDCLNNYNVLAQKGLSTALERSFMRGETANGSLVSVQEIFGGIVKRGTVNVVLEKNGIGQEIFSLGIFTGGLSSFLSSDSETDAEPEDATAGMELSVLGTQMRPFVFFNSQSQLMGHVFSGTASDRTTAFQALIMLPDHFEYIRLGSGFVVELDVKGASSFDLGGKIEISLWNRNAESFVEKLAGISIIGSMRIDSAFVQSQVEFSLSAEPKLLLNTDIDFYSDVSLCMRLSQPESLIRHNVYKIERIPGSKHKLRIAKYRKIVAPGKTYALNHKNNEMCAAIFKG